MSTPPSSATACSTNASQLAGSVTSSAERDVGVDLLDAARAAGDARALGRSARTVAAPIPLDAPVTIARLPLELPTAFRGRA